MTYAVMNLHNYNYFLSGQPFTGRMHQIRVHLQWLGYPIIDDPIYNHKAWGPKRGIGGVDDQAASKAGLKISSK